MNIDYKRDMNHTYMVFPINEIDTSAYQARMLIANVIPSFLKCKIQMLDGAYHIQYEITSKQSIDSIYGDQRIRIDDLTLILSGVIQVIEETSEYLMNHRNLVLNPECIFLDSTKKQMYFCYLPDHNTDISYQMQRLMEYILPLIDHTDEKAVRIGYGVYRKIVEEYWKIEDIRGELYKNDEMSAIQENDTRQNQPIEGEESFTDELIEGTPDRRLDKVSGEDFFAVDYSFVKEQNQKNENSIGLAKKNSGKRIWLAGLITGIFLFVFSILSYLGYLPAFTMLQILAVVTILVAIAMLISLTYDHINNRKRSRSSVKYENDMRYIQDPVPDIKPGKHDENPDNLSKNDLPTNTLEEQNEETVLLSSGFVKQPSALVSKQAGEYATIYLKDGITIIGKMAGAVDALIDLPTVSRIHAKIKKRDGEYYLTDLNSRNGSVLNGRIIKGGEEYLLTDEDEVEFAQARFVFLKSS